MKFSRRADFSEIPIIDIEPLGREGAHEAKVVAAIKDASVHVGFFYICNQDIPHREVQNIFQACERFFSLSQAERDRIYLVNSPNYRGYLPIGALGKNLDRPRDLLESFNIGVELGPDDVDVREGKPLHGPNQWPAHLPAFRDAILHYYGLMETLMRRYNMIGARAHRDFGFFTILLQDSVGGLEVSNQSNQWVVAPPIEDMFVVNVAEMLKRVTNGRFSSALHRVINRYGRERYSVPFFVNPSYDVTLEPLPHFIDDDHPAPFGPYHVGENMHNFYRNLWPSAGKTAA